MRVFSVSQIIVYTCSNCSVILKNHIKPDIKLLDPQTEGFLSCETLHARLKSHYKARSYNKKKKRKIKSKQEGCLERT